MTLAFLDGARRTVGWGPTFAAGDVGADMDRIRDFYADKTGLRPELTTVAAVAGGGGLSEGHGCRRGDSNPHARRHGT